MLAPLVATFALGYVVVSLCFACHLGCGQKMSDIHALFGGALWPLVAYRAIRDGWFENFWKKFDEATNRD